MVSATHFCPETKRVETKRISKIATFTQFRFGVILFNREISNKYNDRKIEKVLLVRKKIVVSVQKLRRLFVVINYFLISFEEDTVPLTFFVFIK